MKTHLKNVVFLVAMFLANVLLGISVAFLGGIVARWLFKAFDLLSLEQERLVVPLFLTMGLLLGVSAGIRYVYLVSKALKARSENAR